MRGAQSLGGISAAVLPVVLGGEVDAGFRTACGHSRGDKVENQATVAGLFPRRNVVVDFGNLAREEVRHTGFVCKGGAELVTENRIVELVNLHAAKVGLQRVGFLDFVHVDAVAIVKGVGVQVGVEVLCRLGLSTEIGNLALQIGVFFGVCLNHIKVGVVGSYRNDGAAQHFGNGLIDALNAVPLHEGTADADKGAGIHGLNGGILAGKLAGKLIDKNVTVVRVESGVRHGCCLPSHPETHSPYHSGPGERAQ